MQVSVKGREQILANLGPGETFTTSHRLIYRHVGQHAKFQALVSVGQADLHCIHGGFAPGSGLNIARVDQCQYCAPDLSF